MSVFVFIKPIIFMVIQRSSSAPSLILPRRAGNAGQPKRKMTMNITRSLTNWRKYRQTVTELGRMTDRELSDLGIGRQDIRRVARTAVGI